jgi:hypothetical protein
MKRPDSALFLLWLLLAVMPAGAQENCVYRFSVLGQAVDSRTALPLEGVQLCYEDNLRFNCGETEYYCCARVNALGWFQLTHPDEVPCDQLTLPDHIFYIVDAEGYEAAFGRVQLQYQIIDDQEHQRTILVVSPKLNTLYLHEDQTTVAGSELELPGVAALLPNYPNPFNSATTITFQLDHTTRMKLEIYDIRGRLVRSLLLTSLPAGEYSHSWDGCDNDGREVASGVYFCRLLTGNTAQTIKMILLR